MPPGDRTVPKRSPATAEAAAEAPPPGPFNQSEPAPGFTALGRVLRPHGLSGELRIQAFSKSASNLAPLRWVHLAGVRRQVVGRREGKGALLVRLSGLDERKAVEDLRGLLIQIPDGEVQRDDDESYFVHELIGLEAVSPAGEPLGTITDVLQPGSADVYVVSGPSGEMLVPAIDAVVREIDLKKGRIVVEVMPGM